VLFLQKSSACLARMLVAAGIILAGHAVDSRPAWAEALLLVDADSGKVLEGENATYPWYPASVTKLMTTYVTLKALRDGRLTLDSLVTVSPNAVAQQPSKMGFKAGTQLTVDNALKMMLVHSANDMAVVLAEGVSGSIDKFSDEMNAAAQRLGMTQTSYVNPNGLPADEQITSARDLAILARALIKEFPEFDPYWHIGSIRLGKRIMRNTNRLIDEYQGADGMKTGFICASGYNLVATATRGNKRLIAVVLGASSSAMRATKAAQLLERGFTASPLSWLMPSLGTVDQLVPVAATPPNLRDDICGKSRGRKASEEAEEEAAAAAAGQGSFLLSNLRGAVVRPTLTSGLASSAPPVDVFVGPPHHPGDPVAAMAVEGKPAGKPAGKSAAKTAAVKPAAKPEGPAESAPPHALPGAVPLKPWPGTESQSASSAAKAKPKPKPTVVAAESKSKSKTAAKTSQH
jgi:D-alanyl-D-alanine carboxypeptidase